MHLAKHSKESRRQAVDLINGLSLDKAWTLTVVPFKKKRSNAQNRWYWGVAIKEIADHTGHEANDLHEWLLGHKFGWETYEVMGSTKKRPSRRSSDMTTAEFAAWGDWVISWAASELGLLINAPGEGL
jgi:hypothetical protein